MAISIPDRVVVFDYGEVISRSPAAADRDALLAIAGGAADEFWAAYWRHRDELDHGILSIVDYWRRVGDDLERDWSPAQVQLLWAADFRSWISVEPQTVELLGELDAGGTRMALLSNAGFDFGDPFRRMPVSRWFEQVFVSAELGLLKPDPAVYRAVADGLGIGTDRMVFIDNKRVDRELLTRAGEMGLLCTSIPEEYGGGGGTFFHEAILIEEQARIGDSSWGAALHSGIVAHYLLHYGTEKQKQEWLPKMASGEVVTAIAMTEPGTGSDLQGIKTKAVREGEDYVVNDVLVPRLRNATVSAAPVLLPPDAHEWVSTTTSEWIEWIETHGVDVIGDLDELRPKPTDPSRWVDPDGPVDPPARHAAREMAEMVAEALARPEPLRQRVRRRRARLVAERRQ